MQQRAAVMDFPYEYVSGVGRLMNLKDATGVEIYVANRGGAEAMARALLIQAPETGVHANRVRFNSGDVFVPGESFGLISWRPLEGGEGERDLGLYWARIFTTSADLVPSMRFYIENDDGTTSVELDCAPGDFAVFSPSNERLLPIPVVNR